MPSKVNVNGKDIEVNTGNCPNFTAKNPANTKFVKVKVNGKGDGEIYKVNSGNCSNFTANSANNANMQQVQTKQAKAQTKQEEKPQANAVQQTNQAKEQQVKDDAKKILVNTAIEQNLDAYIPANNANNTEREKLRTFLTKAAYSMFSVLGFKEKNEYEEVINKYSNDPTDKKNPDAPMFADFVYGYTNQKNGTDQTDYSSQPDELSKQILIKNTDTPPKPVNFYNKNKAGLIACCAYLEYKTGVVGEDGFIKPATELLTNMVNLAEEKLMCIFANLTWRVFEIARDETEICDFKIPIIDLLNSNTDITVNECGKKKGTKQIKIYTAVTLKDTLRKDIVQIYAAAIVLSEMKIPTYANFLELETTTKNGLTPNANQNFKTTTYYNNMIKKLDTDIQTKLEALKEYQQKAVGLKQAEKKGGKPRNLLKASDKRVMINGKSRVVYVGARNVEYIKASGEFVTVKSAVKSAEKAEKAKKTAAKAKKITKNKGGLGGAL